MAQYGLDRVGLAGLGTMGLPIARRLLATGVDLGVWNGLEKTLLDHCRVRFVAAIDAGLADHDITALEKQLRR